MNEALLEKALDGLLKQSDLRARVAVLEESRARDRERTSRLITWCVLLSGMLMLDTFALGALLGNS